MKAFFAFLRIVIICLLFLPYLIPAITSLYNKQEKLHKVQMRASSFKRGEITNDHTINQITYF